MTTDEKSILFLFGSPMAEATALQARGLAAGLRRCGWQVRAAALPAAGRAGEPLAMPVERLGMPVEPVRRGLLGLGYRRMAPPARQVWAWDVRAARSVAAVVGDEVPVRVNLCDPADAPRVSQLRRASRSGVLQVACCSSAVRQALAAAGWSESRVKAIDPAVDRAATEGAASRRGQIREQLGLTADEGPVFTVPPLVGRDEGYLLAAWATLIMRKGGFRSRLVLPAGPRRQTRQAVRFAAACTEPDAVLVAPEETGWLDLVGAADVLVAPTPTLHEPIPLAWAMAAGLPVVTARAVGAESSVLPAGKVVGAESPPAAGEGGTESFPAAGEVGKESSSAAGEGVIRASSAAPGAGLLIDGTHLAAVDAQPLSLARALARVWRGRDLAAALREAARQRVDALCGPGRVADVLRAGD